MKNNSPIRPGHRAGQHRRAPLGRRHRWLSLLIAMLVVAGLEASAPAALAESGGEQQSTPTGTQAATVQPSDDETPAPADESSDPAEPQKPAEGAADNPDPSETPAAEEDPPASEGVSEPTETESEESPDELTPAAAAEDDGPITAFAETPANTYLRVSQPFYAYVGAGENLDISFTKDIESAAGIVDAVITVSGPDGSVRTCTVGQGMPDGTSCDWTNLTSAVPGVWEIDFATSTSGGDSDWYLWEIGVQAGGADIDGRVWSERYQVSQSSGGAPADLEFWYLSEQGFLYDVQYSDYNGINSRITSNATGNALEGTCVSAYESYDGNTPAEGYPYGDEDQFDTTTDECGEPYRIFFEAPDPNMPVDAATWDGGTTWLNPPVTLPTLSNLAFEQEPVTDQRGGEFTVEVTDFVGNASLQIDANNDGDYNDPEDRTVAFAVTGDGTQTIAFDGLDGQGNPISLLDDPIGARVLIDQVGEIHFVNGDVERRAGGIEVEAVRGPDAGSTTIYWDDTNLRVADRDCVTPQLDGTAGVDSSGGVHGWTCNPRTGNANDGVSGAWGDVRFIDDWTFQQVELEVAMTIEDPEDFGDAPDSYGTTIADDGPYHTEHEGLTLGTGWDGEADGQPSADATGDGGDEDGVSGPVNIEVGANNTVEVSATNTTNEPATLAGWVDLDNSGTFEPGELVTVAVPANSGTATYDLAFPGATVTGDSFARFRLYAGTQTEIEDQVGAILPTGGWASGEVEDYQVHLYSNEILKEPVGTPHANADGTHTVEFRITVTRDGTGPGYNLSDVFSVGDSITLNNISSSNVTPGGIATLDNWDAGTSTLEIVADEPIADGDTHEYLVTVNATIDGDAMTFDESDCSLTGNETGTGFLNEAEMDSGGATIEDDACVEATVPDIDKTISSDPAPVGNGEYEVVYQIEVTNPHAGATEYDLDDVLQYGDAITVVGQPQAVAVTGGLSNLENQWDAASSTLRIQTDEPIDAAGGAGNPTVHTYEVTVRFTMELDEVTFENSDCSLTGDESGTGLLNEAVLTVDEQESTDDECPPPSGAPVHKKSIEDGPTPIGDGKYELTYRIQVSNASAGAGEYDLTDQLRYGDAVTVEERPEVVSVTPGGITPLDNWDAATTTLEIVDDQPIAAGTASGPEIHDYIVRVVVSVDAEDVTFENTDCTLGEESGTGLTNEATLGVNGEDYTDDACKEISEPTHDKTVTGKPKAIGDGLFEVEYTIEVVNEGAAASEYDLDDALQYGDPVTVVDTAVSATPGSITTKGNWNGRSNTRLVTDQAIAAGTASDPEVHSYVVTVQYRIAAGGTSAQRDCQLGGGEDGTGLLNTSTMTVNGEESEDDACAKPPPRNTPPPEQNDPPDQSGPGLPGTGGPSMILLGLGLLALLGGGGILAAARRRRTLSAAGQGHWPFEDEV